MKSCMECGKKLGTLQGYYHPTMGKEYFLCGHCFNKVSESVERYMEFITPYVGFFNRESSTVDDLKKIGETISTRVQHMQNKITRLWLHNENESMTENVPIVQQHIIDPYCG